MRVQPVIRILEYTDPGCPFAFSAEPALRKLRWTYGDALEWATRMIVLSSTPEEYLDRGFTPEKQADALRQLGREHGMPIDPRERARMAATEPACRLFVAARRHAPAEAPRVLRRLRIDAMAGALLDEPSTLEAAAREAGLEPEELLAWASEPETQAELAEDAAAARRPDDAGLALHHKLAAAGDDLRYTAPSLVFERISDGARISVPGFQPYAAYEVAVANLAPELERRAPAEAPLDVLAWADEPLASAEVAAVRGIGRDDAREELARVAEAESVGTDGYWSPAA